MRESKLSVRVYWIVGLQTLLTVVALLFSFELRLKPIEMTYHDWIAILLTVLAVILSVLGVFFALLAIIGWQTLRRQVDRQVMALTDNFLHSDKFQEHIAQLIEGYLEKGFRPQGYLRRTLRDAVESVSYDFGEDEDYDFGGDEDVSDA